MRKVIVYSVVTMLSTLGVVIGTTIPASAVVLVNQPAARVCVGHTFKVGVWYQQFSGGSRRYRVIVHNPQHVVVLHKTGTAPTTHWRNWHVPALEVGKYHTVYRTIVRGTWVPYRATTVAHRC